MIPIRDNIPTASPAFVTVSLIVVCSVVFLWELSQPEAAQIRMVYALGFVPGHFFGGDALPVGSPILPSEATLFTSMFLHGGVAHLIGNMLYLWIFGNNVEDAMGHGRFLIFYLLAGLAAALAQGMAAPDSMLPMIGASGAVSGVLGAYLLLYPHARVLVVIPIGFYPYTTYLPATAVLGIWFAMQLLSAIFVSSEEGGVAWFAHLGGFVAGILLILLFRRRGVRLFSQRR